MWKIRSEAVRVDRTSPQPTGAIDRTSFRRWTRLDDLDRRGTRIEGILRIRADGNAADEGATPRSWSRRIPFRPSVPDRRHPAAMPALLSPADAPRALSEEIFVPHPSDERTLARLVEWAGDHDEWGDFRAEVFGAHFGALMEDLGLPDDELFERLGPVTPDVLTAVMEDFLAARFGEDGERNAVDEYLARRGWLEKKHAASYLRAVRDSSPSLYEVVSLEPGRAVTVRDLIRDTGPERVPDRLVSDVVSVWDCFVGRLVGSGRTRRFTVSVLPFPRELVRTCLEDLSELAKKLPKQFREVVRKQSGKADISNLDVHEFLLRGPMGAIFFTSRFVTWHVDQAEAGPGGLENTDGEPLVLSTVRFPIEGSAADVAAVLDTVPEFDREDGGELRWSWRGRELPPLELPESLAGNDPEAGTGYLTLGQVEITGGVLLLRVNSIERAGKGRDLLVARLGALLGTPLTAHEDAATQLGESVEERPPAPRDFDIPPDVAEAVLRAHFEQHYRQVLDEPIPMLGNVTPRKAAKSRKGRAAVVEWLKEIENGEARQAAQTGRQPFDTAWLWEELKIPRPDGKP